MPRALHLLAQLFSLQLTLLSRSNARSAPPLDKDSKSRCNREALQFPVHSPFAVCVSMPSGKLIMMNKRKRDENPERRPKRKGIRKRSRSEPLRGGTSSANAEKREALRRLFGRICSAEIDENLQRADREDMLDDEDLIGWVPPDMDPEQLGFLVCAQETLRFLNGLGISCQHPVFNNLRTRLLQGIGEIGVA